MYQRCNWCSVFNPSVWAFTQFLYANRPHKTSTSWTTIFPPIFGTLEVTSPAFSSWNFPGKPHHKGWSDWKKKQKNKKKLRLFFGEGPKRTFPSILIFWLWNYVGFLGMEVEDGSFGVIQKRRVSSMSALTLSGLPLAFQLPPGYPKTPTGLTHEAKNGNSLICSWVY